MDLPLVLLMEADPERRLALSQAIEEARFRCLPVGDSRAAAAGAVVRPQVVAVSLLSEEGSARDLVRSWHDDEGRAAIPLVAVVAMSSVPAIETALADGADDVLPWPCPRSLVAARLRSVASRGALQERQSDFVRVLASVVAGLEAREPHRVDHSVRVSGLCVELGRRAGIPATEADRLRQAALVYDLGTVSIPDRILWKQGPLSADEMALVRSHPVAGSEMLHGVSSLEPLTRYLLAHHERIDGSGYPYGLRGSEIPVSVQILGLADEYEALVSSRPYRARRSHSEAMAILADEAGRGQFDPALVALLEEALPAADLEAAETSETDGIRGPAGTPSPPAP